MTRLQRFQPLVYPVLLLVLLIAFYWKITLTYEYDWMWGPDLAQQVLPWFEEEARQMQHHHFPLWDPHLWAGQPFLGQAQPGIAYPLNWLLFLFPRQYGHINMLALQWYYVVIHYMAALFCYLLCRDLGLSRFASLTGGLVFALSSYMGTVAWPQMMNGAVWAPLVFLFLLRVVRGRRPFTSAALCGVFWGMSWLSGHHQAPLFISLAAVLTWLFYIIRDRSRRLAALALVAFVFMFFTGALQILPAEQYGRLAVRWVGGPHPVEWNQPVPYEVQRTYSSSPLMVFGVVVPTFDTYTNPFLGVIAVALTVTALAGAWKRPEVKLFTALAIGGFAYALGFHNVFQGFLYAVVPFIEKARTPAMAIVIFGFGAAVLAAFGIDQLSVLRGAAIIRRIGWAIAGFGLLIWFIAYCVLLARGMSWPGDDRVIMTALIAVLAAGLLFAWQKGNVSNRAAAVLLTGLMMIELGNVSDVGFADRNDYKRSQWMQAIRGNQDLARFLGQQAHRFARVDLETDSQELPDNWAEYNNLDSLRGYLAGLTVNWSGTEAHLPQTKSLFGVAYTIGRNTTMPDATPVFDGASGLRVFQNPHAFPRAWAVHEIVSIAKPQDGRVLIADHLEDLHRKAFVSGPAIPLQSCDTPDNVTVTRHDAAHVTIRANMSCDGMVILSDTFYPGWRATVDKMPAAIEEVNFAMRGVRVPRGSHEINYVYHPASVYAGAALSFTGVLAACLIAFFENRRRNAIDLAPKTANNQY